MKDKIINIGISCIGSGVGQSVINSISLSNLKIKTFGFGTNPLAYGLYECEVFVESLSFYDANYIDDTIKKCLEYKIDVYIPGHDDDAHVCAKNISKFNESGIKVIVAGEKLLNICRDKEQMSNYLNPIANIFVKSFDRESFLGAYSAKEVSLPVIAKPRDGYASRGIEIINNEADFVKITELHVVQELAIPHKDDPEHSYYLKQLRKGINPQISEISIQIVADNEGNIIGKMISYNKLNNGIPIEIIPFEDPYIWLEVDKLLPTFQSLGLRGPFNLQGRLTDNGLKLFEMNARFTGITGLRAFMGFNEVEGCIKRWVGFSTRADDFLDFNHNKFGIRQTADKAISFDRNKNVLKKYLNINKHLHKPKKTLLITGGTGYLGRSLVKFVLEKYAGKFELCLLVRDKVKAGKLFGDLKLTIYDIDDFNHGFLSLGNVDVLVHAAFARPQCLPIEIAQSLSFTFDLFESAVSNQVPNIINISSQSVYGQSRKGPLLEKNDVVPDSLYSQAKFATELFLNKAKKRHPHLNLTSLRIGTITGGTDGLQPIDLISKLSLKTLNIDDLNILDGNIEVERIDIRDAVNAISKIICNTEQHFKQVYNVGTNNKILLEQLAEKIIAESKNYISQKITSNLIISKREQELGYLGLDSTLFEEDFNWKPVFSIDDSIKSVFDFYSKKNTDNGEH